jgi:hypothetical protein
MMMERLEESPLQNWGWRVRDLGWTKVRAGAAVSIGDSR